MSKGKEKAIASSSKPARKDYSTIDVSNLSNELQQLRRDQIDKYKSLVKKPFTIRVEESFKPKNIAKILLLSFASVSNVLLVNESLIITYIFVAITCIAPAMYDFKKNYKLLNEQILQKDKNKNFAKKIEKVIKFTLPGSVGLVVDVIFIAIHMSRVETSIASDILLGLGTFIAGGSQMLVNPLIRKEVARLNLNKLREKNIDDPEVLQLIEKEANFEQVVEQMKALDATQEYTMKANLEIATTKLAEVSSELEGFRNHRAKEFISFATVIAIKSLQNNELRADKETAEQTIRELTFKTKKEKKELQANFEKIINEKDFAIQQMENEIKTLTQKQKNYDPELAQASSHVDKLKKENKGIGRGT